MATAGSAVSTREQNWEEFRETVKKVKGELINKIQSLTEALQGVKEIYDEYYIKYNNKHPLASEIIREAQNDLMPMLVKLKEELRKAVSEDVTIVFVGRTSSGKSSLINALLRDDRLPTGPCTTTMCTFEVRPTPDVLWNVIDTGTGTILSKIKDKEEVKKFLDALVDEKTEKEREKQNINCESVIRVNWPRNLCSLPEDIVLVDTPGLGESNKWDQAVANSCKKADLMVAVMDFMSPSIQDVVGVLNERQFQFKFGVFTKWDEVTKKNSETTRQQARKNYKKRFEQSVKDKQEVYFVEAENTTLATETAERNTGREEFLRFERDLAERAKSVKVGKGVVLIKLAEDIASKFAEGSEKFTHIINDRKRTTKDRLESLQKEISIMEEDLESLDTVRQEVRGLDKLICNHLSSEEIDRLKQELGDCNSQETVKQAIEALFDSQINVIEENLQEKTREVEAKFQNWKDALRYNYGCSENKVPSYRAKQSEDDGRAEQKYNWRDYGWKFVSAACAIGMAIEEPSKGVPIAFGMCAASAMYQMAKLYHKKSEFKEKAQQIVQTSLEKMRARFEQFIESASEIVERSSDSVLSHIRRARVGSFEEMSAMEEELQKLETWSRKLREITDCLQVVRKELDELKDWLKVNDTVPSDDQTENQSSVQTAEYKPYTQI